MGKRPSETNGHKRLGMYERWVAGIIAVVLAAALIGGFVFTFRVNAFMTIVGRDVPEIRTDLKSVVKTTAEHETRITVLEKDNE